MLTKIFRSRNKNFKKRFCRKYTLQFYYCSNITVLGKVIKEYMNNITSIRENVGTIENDKIVNLPWLPKVGPNLRKEF